MELFYMPRKTNKSSRTPGSREAYKLLEYVFYKKFCQKLPTIKKTPNGKPYFPNRSEIHFSISHSAGHVLCALSDFPVGADIENPRSITPRAVRYFSSPEELRHFKPLELWVLKESFIKLHGGKLPDVKKIRFTCERGKIVTHEPDVAAKLFHIENDNCLIAVCSKGGLPRAPERVDATDVSRVLRDCL